MKLSSNNKALAAQAVDLSDNRFLRDSLFLLIAADAHHMRRLFPLCWKRKTGHFFEPSQKLYYAVLQMQVFCDTVRMYLEYTCASVSRKPDIFDVRLANF